MTEEKRTSSTHALLDYLKALAPGPIQDAGELEPRLATSWGEFDGGGAEGMTGYKLLGRMRDIAWNPPVLSFRIERHGGTLRGSTRAELHEWEINIEERTAQYWQTCYRQVQPMQPRLDVRTMAEEIAQLISAKEEDERLKWERDGTVRVAIGKVLPVGSAVAQTLNSRRKRFRVALDGLMRAAGWQRVRPNLYAPPGRQRA